MMNSEGTPGNATVLNQASIKSGPINTISGAMGKSKDMPTGANHGARMK